MSGATLGRPHLEVWFRGEQWFACLPGLYGAPLFEADLGLSLAEIRALLQLLFGAEVK